MRRFEQSLEELINSKINWLQTPVVL